MTIMPVDQIIRLGLPKGRMQDNVFALLEDAGIHIRSGGSSSTRDYRPKLSLPGFDAKLLKPQNIVEMLDVGSRDLGFAGADWVAEKEADLVELVDTGLDHVQLVAAAPVKLLVDGALPGQHLVIASEYERLTRDWIARANLDATFVRSYGATEVFPPEDADCIVDNSATGSTLRANGLEIVGEVMTSSTRLYAHPASLEDADKRAAIYSFVMMVGSVLDARRRVMVEVNVTADDLEAVIDVLPSMREPTISPLHGAGGFAIKSAVPRDELAQVIPRIKAQGGTDIVVSPIGNIVS
ncbi:MAG: ATP phosphoribosyltransferase [Rhodospirillaceae bacterium]|nr:ATP phosphoribosyltransferase [Rhodospirillaceae bacterium]|tara:strand:+ start:11549 stop:12436 length:888 start_codon:yes stop_codon:yes gene_type:complete